MSITIYALRDPRTWEVRYIGKTAHSVEERLRKHVNLALRGHRDHKYNWLRQLLAAGREPTLAILEELPHDADWEEAEVWWIAEGRRRGWPLTNQTDGGEGQSKGFRHTVESRARISKSNRGRKHSPESRARIRASLLGRPHSASRRAAISAGIRRDSISEEHKLKISVAQTGQRCSAQTRERISAARIGHEVAPETRAGISKALKGRKMKRLEEEDVGEIRAKYATGEITQKKLAADYDVHVATILNIVNYHTWRNVA